MPYKKYTKTVKGKKKYCIKNKNTGKETCFCSEEKRNNGIRIREAYAHSWKPKKLKSKK